jgi:hypothetical protein
MIKINVLHGMEEKSMTTQELKELEKYCLENGWTAYDLKGVVIDSIEEEFIGDKILPDDTRELLNILLTEFETVDRVLALLPASGEDY